MRLSILILLLTTTICFGQNHEKYAACTKQAEKLYDLNEFQNSADKYKEAFDLIDGKASSSSDRYNAACSYALAKDVESSFSHLFRLAKSRAKYNKYGHISIDTDLNILHQDERWEELLAIVKVNKDEAEKDFDKPLMVKLDSIHDKDQKCRGELRKITEKFGRQSDELKAHWKIILEKDSINLVKVEKILDERGWLGSNVIGGQGNMTLFLVIQHSDLETQVKYLPMMHEAVKKGNARASNLALLEDRVALRQGKRQIYGSQIHSDKETGEMYVAPLIDPENVDKRRAEVGLGKLAEYVSNWKLIWDVEKHKARTAKIEAVKKVQ
ncbi:DUF6624 domain-containing protein [Ancylomarina sp.]|uniref:DUF6624 domain-containing protein n=1 Tax=Ancylomarina sp. TaxID=1970196 RepID=UPI003566719B